LQPLQQPRQRRMRCKKVVVTIVALQRFRHIELHKDIVLLVAKVLSGYIGAFFFVTLWAFKMEELDIFHFFKKKYHSILLEPSNVFSFIFVFFFFSSH
jgi:hypothetical protein